MNLPDFHEYVQRVKQVNLHPRQTAQLDVYTATQITKYLTILFFTVRQVLASTAKRCILFLHLVKVN